MLPETLDIPDSIAASLRFDHGLNARDRALLFVVSWWSARHEIDDDGDLDIPDLYLRRNLGDMRRSDAEREQARYDRFAAFALRSDVVPDLMDGVPAPTTPSGERRVYRKGAKRWRIDHRLRTAFAIEKGEEVVGVPLRVLAHARCRYTLPTLLRFLSWGSGGFDRRWLRRDRKDHIVLRIPIDALRTEIGSVGKLAPANFLRKDLAPAIREIAELTDMAVDIEPVQAPSIRADGGRVIAYDILISKIEPRVADADTLPEHAIPAPTRPAQITAFRPIRFGPQSGAPASRDTSDDEVAF